MTQQNPIKLSICIATFNRSALIGATLESIISQITDDCEIVVSDNASTDNTQAVVLDYANRCGHLRYIKQKENKGLDRNFDASVEHARGEYCWLMCDDDLLKPGAIDRVLTSLRTRPCLLIVNLERINLESGEMLIPRFFPATSDRRYAPDEFDQLFKDVGARMMLISCIVIQRDLWRARQRECYFGTMFAHVGVVFQSPLPSDTLFIAEPLISYRDHSSRSFWSELFEILMIRWPAFIWSLAPSASAKIVVAKPEPWREFLHLLLYRGFGWYSLRDYRRLLHPRTRTARERLSPLLIALLPGMLTNIICTLICLRFRDTLGLFFLRESRFSLRNSIRQGISLLRDLPAATQQKNVVR